MHLNFYSGNTGFTRVTAAITGYPAVTPKAVGGNIAEDFNPVSVLFMSVLFMCLVYVSNNEFDRIIHTKKT